MARRKHRRDDPERTTALVYIRVSKYDEERDRKAGREPRRHQVSPETQLEHCKALPVVKGLALEVFQDLDYTGRNTKRPGFKRMMERAAQSDVKLVACYKLSRLSRSVVDFYGTLQRLEEMGVAFVSATEPVETTTPIGKAFLGILAVLAELESDTTSERVADAMATKRDRGEVGGQPPVGYKRDKGLLVIDEDWAPVVREIFSMYAAHRWSFQRLARHLNAQEVRAPKGAKDGHWQGPALQAMMRNPTFIAKTHEGNPASHLPLIDKAVWDRCQDVRRLNMRRKGEYGGRGTDHALSGLAFCSRCGQPMHYRGPRAASGGRPASDIDYYRCKASYQSRTCDAPYVPAKLLETAIRSNLAEWASPDEIEPASRTRIEIGLGKTANPKQAFSARTKALEERSRRVKLQHELGDVADDEYRQRMGAINLEKVALREEIAKAPNVDVAAGRERIASLASMWDRSSGAERNVVLNEIFQKVEVNKTGSGVVVTIIPKPSWLAFFRNAIGPGEGKTAKWLAAGGEARTPGGWQC